MTQDERRFWDEFDYLQEVGMDKKVNRLAEISQTITELNDEAKDLRVELTGYLETVDQKSIYCEGFTVSWSHRKASRILDKDKLKQYLAESGVPAPVIADCIDRATRLGKSPDATVTLRPIK